MPKNEVDKLRALLSQRETEILTLSVESQSMKKKLEQNESETFEEIQKLTKELSVTRTYL